MRELRRMAWAAALGLAVASPAFAQTTTGGTLGTPATQATTTGTTANTTNAGQGTTNVGSSTPMGATSTPQSNFTAASQLQAPSKYANGSSNSAIAASNPFKNYFANPYYQGINSTNQPGGFGTALYPATTSGTRGGTAGQGGRAGAASSSVNTTDPGGILAPLPRQIAYASQIQFKLPPGAGLTQLQTDLRGSIDRIPTTMLANPAGVKVEVDGRSVVLRGSVRDEEESHLVEGMVRLTPGVGAIKNELAFPK